MGLRHMRGRAALDRAGLVRGARVRPTRVRVARVRAMALLLVVGIAGCSGGSGNEAESDPPSEEATTAAASPTAELTTEPAPPVTASEPCPYLDRGYIEETVGQRIPEVETITVDGQPAPDCIFYRNDETASVTIDLTQYADPVAAQNAALALVTTAATPITDIGDYGGVLVTDQTLLAVTRGPLLVSVITNQPSSLQAREIAATVLAAIPPG